MVVWTFIAWTRRMSEYLNYFNLSFVDERKSYVLGTTWYWIKDGIEDHFKFGGNLSLLETIRKDTRYNVLCTFCQHCDDTDSNQGRLLSEHILKTSPDTHKWPKSISFSLHSLRQILYLSLTVLSQLCPFHQTSQVFCIQLSKAFSSAYSQTQCAPVQFVFKWINAVTHIFGLQISYNFL